MYTCIWTYARVYVYMYIRHIVNLPYRRINYFQVYFLDSPIRRNTPLYIPLQLSVQVRLAKTLRFRNLDLQEPYLHPNILWNIIFSRSQPANTKMYPFGQEVLFGFAGWDLLNVFCIQPLTPKWLKPIVTKLALEQNDGSTQGYSY